VRDGWSSSVGASRSSKIARSVKEYQLRRCGKNVYENHEKASLDISAFVGSLDHISQVSSMAAEDPSGMAAKDPSGKDSSN
jgi:hypothetical protein